MEEILYNSQMIAIPVKQKPGIESSLGLAEPNFFCIEGVKELTEMLFPDSEGNLQVTTAFDCFFKLVHREVLPQNAFFPVQYIERGFIPIEVRSFPAFILPMVKSHLTIKQNIEYLNQCFELFEFRGILKDLKLQIDADVLDLILNNQ